MPHARALLTAALAALAALAAAAGASAQELAGTTWLTEGGKARVAFAEEDGKLVGRFVWLKKEEETGAPELDDKNPDPALRTRPLNGLVMAWDLESDGPGVWDGGQVYAPDDGKTYNAKATLEGDVLTLTGCIRWPLCRDATWTRVP